MLNIINKSVNHSYSKAIALMKITVIEKKF